MGEWIGGWGGWCGRRECVMWSEREHESERDAGSVRVSRVRVSASAWQTSTHTQRRRIALSPRAERGDVSVAAQQA